MDSPYLRDEALNLLKKRVYWSDNINTFVRIIADFLEGKPPDQKPDINNTEYLEMFGLSKLDGKVAERALGILEAETRTALNTGLFFPTALPDQQADQCNLHQESGNDNYQ